MSGAGDSSAGTGPAGFAPIGPFSTRKTTTPPRATNYNPFTKDFTTSVTNGVALYDAIHPVDQQVILALSIPLGSLKSAPTVGHRLREVNRLSGPQLERAVQDRIRLALKSLVDRGKISILSVEVDVHVSGQLKVATSYQNLVTRKLFAGKKAVSTFTPFRSAA